MLLRSILHFVPLTSLPFLHFFHFSNIDPHAVLLGCSFVSVPCFPLGLGFHSRGRRGRDVAVALHGLFGDSVHQPFLPATHRSLQLLDSRTGHLKLLLAH